MDGSPGTPQNQNSWQFRADTAAPYVDQHLGQMAMMAPTPEQELSWTASEFIAHHKTTGWYAALAAGSIVVSTALYFITKDIVTSVFIVLAAGIFGAFAGRQPRELPYRIGASGISIGRRRFAFEDFRSFSVMREGAFSSIALVPIKRFAPLTSMYYDPRQEQAIVDALSRYLPMEQRKSDPIDRLMWRMRF